MNNSEFDCCPDGDYLFLGDYVDTDEGWILTGDFASVDRRLVVVVRFGRVIDSSWLVRKYLAKAGDERINRLGVGLKGWGGK